MSMPKIPMRKFTANPGERRINGKHVATCVDTGVKSARGHQSNNWHVI